MPAKGRGHVLISSNNPHWSSLTPRQMKLEGLAPEDAVQFLLQRTHSSDEVAAVQIAEGFERLPLALEQAAAYAETKDISLAEYSRLLAEHRPQLLDARSQFTQYPESVYSAFSLSVEAANTKHQEAGALLAYLAYMHPSGVPRGLAKDAMRILFDQHELAFDDLAFNDLVAALPNFSLVNAGHDSLASHSLLLAFVRDQLPEDARRAWGRFSVNILTFAFPRNADDSSTWSKCRELVDHVVTASEFVDYLEWGDPVRGSSLQ